ncbi:hypothetical protein FQR65_LT15806 [Abscondita terminalis]|nr:hypothetical protein FQR65_LT15806 [Abscondita terminalis]
MALQLHGMIMIQNLEAFERARIAQRILRDNSNPFELPDCTFKKLFRVGKPCAQYIIETLTPHLQDQQRNTFIANELKVGISDMN